MEHEATSSHNQVTNKSDEEDAIMAVFDAVGDASEGEPYEQEVGQSIYNLR